MAEKIADLKERVDLGALIALDLGQPRRKAGRWLFWPCPFHRDNDPSFGVTPDTGRYKCFGCGETGDHIDYLEKAHSLTTGEAKKELERVAGLPSIPKPQPMAETPNDDPPGEKWQECGWAFLAWAADQLWTDAGKPGLDYLRNGGLADETIKAWGLGWCPGGPTERWKHDGRPVYLHKGAVMSCEVAGVLWYVKIRRFDAQGKPETEPGKKYGQPSGGRGALFGADHLQADGRPLLLCEGERDALLVWQELRDLVDVATFGGAGKRGLGRWALWMLPYKQILAAFDADESGQKGAAWWVSLGRRFRAVQVPHGDDLTDFHRAGGDLRAWLQTALPYSIESETPALDADTADKLGQAREWAADAEVYGIPCKEAPSWADWLAGVEAELTSGIAYWNADSHHERGKFDAAPR